MCIWVVLMQFARNHWFVIFLQCTVYIVFRALTSSYCTRESRGIKLDCICLPSTALAVKVLGKFYKKKNRNFEFMRFLRHTLWPIIWDTDLPRLHIHVSWNYNTDRMMSEFQVFFFQSANRWWWQARFWKNQ